jgi:hypothetical protein
VPNLNKGSRLSSLVGNLNGQENKTVNRTHNFAEHFRRPWSLKLNRPGQASVAELTASQQPYR